MENSEVFANAIVVKAVDDFRRNRKTIKKLKDRLKNIETDQRRILEFFKSKWFGILTDIDAEMLIEKLEKEFDKGEANYLNDPAPLPFEADECPIIINDWEGGL